MKKLDTKVNIIPIIAKADTISKTELQKFKVCEIFIEMTFIRFTCYLLYLIYCNICISEQNNIRVAKQWNTYLSVSNR